MGKITGTVRVGDVVKPMHSFLANFMYLLNGAFQRTTNANVIDTGNTARTVGGWQNNGTQLGWNYCGGIPLNQPLYGVSAYGIQVGSNATAVVITDYKLNTQIAHGVGAGELKYGAQAYLSNLSSGTNRFVRISRPFYNDSGGDVTIREIGLVMTPEASYGGAYNVLIARDLTGDVVVSTTNATVVEISLKIAP
jgi:hypothetical protein